MLHRLKHFWMLAVLVAAAPLGAQSQAFFPIEEVRPGLKGVGRTVFEGVRVEEFDVELLGVLENVQGPRQNLILARLSGKDLKKTGVFAGMSGSPVYIDGRLLGAVAYSFSFAREPIAGITPIQEMVDVFSAQTPTSFRVPVEVNPASLYSPRLRPSPAGGFAAVKVDIPSGFESMGSLIPISTPVALSGVPPEALAPLADSWRSFGMVPVMGTAGGRLNDFPDAPMVPGSSVSVQMIRGDIDVSAGGTVTHLDGDKIYAFGHPFMGVGSTEMPLNKAAVLTIIPSLASSQKMSATGAFVGSIRQDRSTGVYGIRGHEPDLLPVNLKLETSRGEQKSFDFEIVNGEFLTPFMMTLAVNSSILASERSLGEQTLQILSRIAIDGHPDIEFQNSVSDPASSAALAAITAAAPIQLLLGSGLNPKLEGVEVEITAVEENRRARLEKVWQDRLEARPGEEVGLTLFLRRPDGELIAEKQTVLIPNDLPPGPLKIAVGDGVSLIQDEAVRASEDSFIPEDVGQLVRAINNLRKNDRLYIRLFRDADGVVVAGEGLPGLPPSMLAIYGSSKTSRDAKAIRRVVLQERELPSTGLVLSGTEVLTVQVTR